MNDNYVQILSEVGIKYDCSATPSVDWISLEGITVGSKGSDYSAAIRECYVALQDARKRLIGYPMTIVNCRLIVISSVVTPRNLLKSAYHCMKKTKIWIRPNFYNLNGIKYILKTVYWPNEEYAKFMIRFLQF